MIYMEVLSTGKETFEGKGKGWGKKETKGKNDRAEMSDNKIIMCWGRNREKGRGSVECQRHYDWQGWNERCSILRLFSNAWIKIL